MNITPTAAKDVQWRQEVGWGYPGIAPSGPVVIVGGPVWVWLHGVAFPPGTQTQGTQDVWMVVDGVWILPAKLTQPWPRRARPYD